MNLPESKAMKHLKLAVVAAALICLNLPAQTNDWSVGVDGDSSARRARFQFTESGVSGEVFGSPFEGVRTGDQIEFRSGPFLWRGRVDGDRIEGWMKSDTSTNLWKARKLPVPGTPRKFVHKPEVYHRHFDSRTRPALVLLPGDSVATSTLDAAGMDREGRSCSWGGNPLTGPYVVDGAMPGDVLVVTLKKVRTNRDWAFAGRELVETALDAAYLTGRSRERIENTWTLDPKEGVTYPRNPTEGLKGLRLPLQPFLGCLGVAPSDGAASTSKESGSYGGNMECRWICEGSKVFLPVGMPGAYLYLGDGHASQGDGELAGNALETSLDVEFEVDLIRSKWQGAPRVETATEIISIGIADSLDIAVRTATTGMARWLETGFGLTTAETAVFLGFQNSYTIPDMVPPGVSVASRIPKAFLPRKDSGK